MGQKKAALKRAGRKRESLCVYVFAERNRERESERDRRTDGQTDRMTEQWI